MESLPIKSTNLKRLKRHDDSIPLAEPGFLPIKESIPSGEEEKYEEKCEITEMHNSWKSNHSNTKIMVLFIKASNKEIFEIKADPSDTIYNVKCEIFEKEGILGSDQTLKYRDRVLKEDKTLEECQIPDGAVLQLTVRVKHSCFPPETPVTMSDGLTKKIKDVSIGDKILAYDTEKKVLYPKTVTSVGIYQTDCLCEIDLGNSKIICTPNHPFWVPNKGWRAVQTYLDYKAEPLRVGDSLLTTDLITIKIKSIRVFELRSIVNVYSLHIESAHNFFAYGVLAHNFQIMVRSGVTTYALNIDFNDQIFKIKVELQKQTGKDPGDQCLVFAGVILEDHRTLSDYSIRKENVFHLYSHCSVSSLPLKEINLNILYKTVTYLMPCVSIMTVKGLRQQVADIVNVNQKELSLLYGGKLLLEDEQTISDCGITDNSDIMVIPPSEGGNCLGFMQQIYKTPSKDLEAFKASFDFLTPERKIYLTNLWEIGSQKMANIFGKSFEHSENAADVYAVMAWTIDAFYDLINEDLEKGKDLSRWYLYLKHFVKGLQLMPYYQEKCYRGLSVKVDPNAYKKGSIIVWRRMSALSKSKKVAEDYCQGKGTILEVETVSTRDISSISLMEDEEEVILLPYSYLEVIEVVEAPNKPLLIRLREIPVPRGPRIVVWVDDVPKNNYKYAAELEKKGVSCVFCTSTDDALRVINNFRWLLYFDHGDFKIVTDMVRLEGSIWNYYAGINLLKELFQTYKYTFEVLVFCKDVKKAMENCKKLKLEGAYQITKEESDLKVFIKL